MSIEPFAVLVSKPPMYTLPTLSVPPPRRQHCPQSTGTSPGLTGAGRHLLVAQALLKEPPWRAQVPPGPIRAAVGVLGGQECLPQLRLLEWHPLPLELRRPVSPQYGTRQPRVAAATRLKGVRTGADARGKGSRPAATQHPHLPGRGSGFTNPARPAQSDRHPRHPAHAATQIPPADSSRTPKSGEPRQSPLTLSSWLPFCRLS